MGSLYANRNRGKIRELCSTESSVAHNRCERKSLLFNHTSDHGEILHAAFLPQRQRRPSVESQRFESKCSPTLYLVPSPKSRFCTIQNRARGLVRIKLRFTTVSCTLYSNFPQRRLLKLNQPCRYGNVAKFSFKC